MRRPIMVQAPTFEVNTVLSKIDTIREAFDQYLDHYRSRKTSSRHGLMGPVGKLLREVKSGRRDRESLKGYTLRVHEVTGQYVSEEGIAALEKAIDELVVLLNQVPVTAIDRVIDRLEYGLFFSRRKKGMEQREALNRQFRLFLQDRYQTPAELGRSWGEPIAEWNRIYVFGPESKTRRTASKTKKSDMDAFLEQLKVQTVVPVEALLEDEQEEV